jgi:hypothetical protein
MGVAHKIVTDVCEEYFAKMRRLVYQTPQRFLQFLQDYNTMYVQKSLEITVKASRVEIGLEKLKLGIKFILNSELFFVRCRKFYGSLGSLVIFLDCLFFQFLLCSCNYQYYYYYYYYYYNN